MEKLLSTKELAAFLGLEIVTIQKKVQANAIPHIRISPRCVRFEASAILRWLAEKKVSPVRKPLSLVRGGR